MTKRKRNTKNNFETEKRSAKKQNIWSNNLRSWAENPT